MQISQALKRSKRGSIHFRRRLSIVLIVALLVVAIVLVAFRGFSEFSVAGERNNPGSAIGSSGSLTGSSASNNNVGSYITNFGSRGSTPTPTPSSNPTPTPTPLEPTYESFGLEAVPEFGLGGGAIALVICFLAFGLFLKRGNLKTIKA